MRSTPSTRAFLARRLLAAGAAGLLLCGATVAQTTPPQAPASTASAAQAVRPEQRTENIHIEDASNRIDEVRVGGETRSITVQPKGGMPSYQVAPATGERRWNVLGF